MRKVTYVEINFQKVYNKIGTHVRMGIRFIGGVYIMTKETLIKKLNGINIELLNGEDFEYVISIIKKGEGAQIAPSKKM